MLKNFVRTCDLCHREVPVGKHQQRRISPDGLDLLVVLMENQEDNGFALIEEPDGALAFDTCFSCYTRMTFVHSHALN